MSDDAPAERIQARVTLPVLLRERIDALRVRWNPEAAAGNPAHCTVVYHDEARDSAQLRARLALACRSTPPFLLQLGEVGRFPAPLRGAFVAVSDPSGAIAALRSRVLIAPCTPRERFGLHVTLLHPSQGNRLAEAWPELSSLEAGASFRVEEVQLIAGSGDRTRTLDAFALEGKE